MLLVSQGAKKFVIIMKEMNQRSEFAKGNAEFCITINGKKLSSAEQQVPIKMNYRKSSDL